MLEWWFDYIKKYIYIYILHKPVTQLWGGGNNQNKLLWKLSVAPLVPSFVTWWREKIEWNISKSFRDMRQNWPRWHHYTGRDSFSVSNLTYLFFSLFLLIVFPAFPLTALVHIRSFTVAFLFFNPCNILECVRASSESVLGHLSCVWCYQP